jgi:hypothetical protein
MSQPRQQVAAPHRIAKHGWTTEVAAHRWKNRIAKLPRWDWKTNTFLRPTITFKQPPQVVYFDDQRSDMFMPYKELKKMIASAKIKVRHQKKELKRKQTSQQKALRLHNREEALIDDQLKWAERCVYWDMPPPIKKQKRKAIKEKVAIPERKKRKLKKLTLHQSASSSI